MERLRAANLMIKTVFIWISLLLPLASLASAQTLNDPKLQVEQVVQGLSLPTNMAFIGLDDILVLQKNDGRVRRALSGEVQPGQVLDVAVDNSSERGLLGIAVHPGFPGTPSVYLYYTESSTGDDTSGSPTPLGNRVYRYTWDGSALINPTLILDLPVTPGPNHDGGIITFGPDGKLYVVIGDLRRNGQLQYFPTGPLPDDTSVILRLNDDGTIPSDNPFFAEGGNLAKYYAYGIRNSFGMAFDPVTGKLWDTENGPKDYDEINLVESGFNSGWEQIMGPDARDPQGTDDLFDVPGSQYSDPEFSWFDTVGPTAIVFLNSVLLGEQYQDDVFVGDINNGTVYHFEPNATRDGFDFENLDLSDLVADTENELEELIFGTGFGGITDLKVGPDGLLYILSLSLGKIFRVFSQVSGTVNGLASRAICKNKVTAQKVKNLFSPPNWDCSGLSTISGDSVVVTLKGKSDGTAIGGTVTGLNPVNRVKCINKTTLAKARGTFSLPDWDCGLLPLPISGDRVRVKIRGSAE